MSGGTSRMAYLSLRLFCLLFAASFLQSSASSNTGVSLNCSQPEEVEAEDQVTLKCLIIFRDSENCKGERCIWNKALSLAEYECEWDRLTYASLTIPNVEEEENYKLSIHTDCGLATSCIKVPVKQNSIHDCGAAESGVSVTADRSAIVVPEDNSSVIPAISIVLIFICALGFLIFLFRANKVRQICVKNVSRGARRQVAQKLTGEELV